jgi:hypothetical protein
MTVNSLGLPNGVNLGGNNLTSYVEGTWTPVPAVGANTGWTYGIYNATYTRIGNVVHVTAYIVVTAKGSATGNFAISGLPFPTRNASSGYQGTNLYMFNLISYPAADIKAYVAAGTSAFTISAGATAITDAVLQLNSDVIINFTYQI